MLILRFSMEKLHNKPTCLVISKWERKREALTSLTLLSKRFLDGEVAQQAETLENHNAGKKKRSTQAVDTISKKFLDGQVAQQAKTLTNHNAGKKKRSAQAVESHSKRFLDGKVAQQAEILVDHNGGMKKGSTQAAKSLSKRLIDGHFHTTPVPFVDFDTNGIIKRDWVNDFFADRPFSMKQGDKIANVNMNN
jgi:hypothetical protein